MDLAQVTKARKMFLRGMSIHTVALNCGISTEEATQIQRDVAEEIKQDAITHKIVLRNALREAMPKAVDLLRNVVTHDPEMKSQIHKDMATNNGRAKVAMQIRAAQALLSGSTQALNDNILTMLSERPSAEPVQKTLFDFASEIDERGGMRLVVTPREAQNE